MSTTTVANWDADFLISATFLSLTEAISRTGTFLRYTGLAVLAVIFFGCGCPRPWAAPWRKIQDQVVGSRASA